MEKFDFIESDLIGYVVPTRYAEAYSPDPPVDIRTPFYIYGPTGTGKTYLSWGLVNSRKKERDVRSAESRVKWYEDTSKPEPWFDRRLFWVVNTPKMVTDYRNGSFDKKADFIREACIRPLIFDDIGAEYQSEFSQELILTFLDERWNKELWTGFTSNLSIGNLPYGDRIKSRIAGMVGKNIYKLDGKDKRLP